MTRKSWRKKVAAADKKAILLEKKIKTYTERIKKLKVKLEEMGDYEKALRDAEPE